MSGCRTGRLVHLLLQHSLVDRAHRVFRAPENLRVHSFCLPKGEFGDGVADATLDALRAQGDFVVSLSFAPFLRAVRVADGHADDRDGGVDSAERNDPRNAPSGANDDLATDLLAQDAVRRTHISGLLRRDRRRLQPETVLAHGCSGVEDDGVLGGAPVLEREVEAEKLELSTDDLRR